MMDDRQIATLKEIVRELDAVAGNPFIDEMRVMLGQRLGEFEESTEYPLLVHFDSKENYVGRTYIREMFEAVKFKVALKFEYSPFHQEKHTITLSPHILKQYNHRWYCLGQLHNQSRHIANVALDRIVGPVRKVDGFQSSELTREDLNDRFQEIVGVTYSEQQEPVNIHLRFHGKSRGYVFTKPLSICQRPLSFDDLKSDPMDVHLEEIRINFELKQQIFFYADQVEIVSPESLRKEMEIIYLSGAALNKTPE